MKKYIKPNIREISLYTYSLLAGSIMTVNDEDAKDVVQDVFTNLWVKANTINIKSPLAPFLFCATRNNILNRIKHLKVKAKFDEHIQYFFDHLTELPDSSIITKDEWARLELAKQIEEGTQIMPPKMREIFIMSRIEHLPHKAISKQLNISDKTVKKQITNALNILRVKLELYKFIIYFFFIYTL